MLSQYDVGLICGLRQDGILGGMRTMIVMCLFISQIFRFVYLVEHTYSVQIKVQTAEKYSSIEINKI